MSEPQPPPVIRAPPAIQRRGRWQRLVAVVAGIAVVAAGIFVGVVVLRHTSAPSQSSSHSQSQPHHTTVGEAIMARHADQNGVLDFEGALQLFSYAFDPLPGISLPAGATDDRANWGDVAASEIAAHIGELTSAQRQVVLSYLGDVSGAGAPVSLARTTSSPQPSVVLANLIPQPAQYVRQDIAALKMLQRIGTRQKSVAQSIPLPSGNLTSGGVEASATSVFYLGDSGTYRIDDQAVSLVKINDAGTGVFVDNSMWVQIDSGNVGFVDTYGVLAKMLAAGRDLVGADETNVYIEDPSNKGILQYPIDGSQGNALGTSNEGSASVLGYLIVGSHNAFRVYGAAESQGGPFALYVENYPLP